MPILDDLRELQQLHASGALTDAEFTQAKSKLLAEQNAAATSTKDPAVVEELTRLRQQSELEQLDREWAMEREQHMTTGRYGTRHLPSSDGAYIGGAIFIGFFGGCWTIMSISMGAPFFFPLFGLAFIAVGVGSCLSKLGKAEQYEQAKRNYENRRAELQTRYGAGK